MQRSLVVIEQADSFFALLSTVLVTGASVWRASVVRRLHEEHPLAKIHILGRNASGVRELMAFPSRIDWDWDVGQLDSKALLGVDGLVHLPAKPSPNGGPPASRHH